jgi:hypothetical protein
MIQDEAFIIVRKRRDGIKPKFIKDYDKFYFILEDAENELKKLTRYKKKIKPKLFIGMEETNISQFVSPCCHTGLSLEPLCRIACGECGKTISENRAIYVGKPIYDQLFTIFRCKIKISDITITIKEEIKPAAK